MAAVETTWINVTGLPKTPQPFSKLNPEAPDFIPTCNSNSVPSTSSPPEFQSAPIPTCGTNYQLCQPIQTSYPPSFNNINGVSAHMPINQVDCNFIEAGPIIEEVVHSSDYSEYPSEEVFVNSQDSGTYSHEDQNQNYERRLHRDVNSLRGFFRGHGHKYPNSGCYHRSSVKFDRRRNDLRFRDDDFHNKEYFNDERKWEKKNFSSRAKYHGNDNNRGRGDGHYREAGVSRYRQEHMSERSQKKTFKRENYRQRESRELLEDNFTHHKPHGKEKMESSKILTGEIDWRRNSDLQQEWQESYGIDANFRNEGKVPVVDHSENITQVPEETNIQENRSKSPRDRRRTSRSPQTQRKSGKKDTVKAMHSTGGTDHPTRTRKADTSYFSRNEMEKRKQGEESKWRKEKDSETPQQDSRGSESHKGSNSRKQDKSSSPTGAPRFTSPPKETVNRDEEETPTVKEQLLEKSKITERQQKPERIHREKQPKGEEKDEKKPDNYNFPSAPEKTSMSLNSIEVSRKFMKEGKERSGNKRDKYPRRVPNKNHSARDRDKKSEAKDVIVQSERTSDNSNEKSTDRGKIVAQVAIELCHKKHDKKPEEEHSKKINNVCETRKFMDPRMEREKQRFSNPGRLPDHCGRYRDDVDVVGKYFDQWEKDWETIKEFKVVNEIFGDLFEQPKEFSLAHCVAEDLRMGSGIAVAFKRDFKNLPELLDQRAKQGGLATLYDDKSNRYVYYLITKRESMAKPTYLSLWKSLWKMRAHISENNVKKVAVPRLGCGLDRLEWEKVKSMLEFLFKDVDIEIRVCNFQQSEQVEERKSKCKLVVEEYPITKIPAGTLLIYLALVTGNPDEIMLKMAKQTKFLPEFQKHQPKYLGEIVYYDDKATNLGVCGCIVRNTAQDPLSFVSLGKCIDSINKLNRGFKSEKFEYVAFQWVDEKDYFDDCINEKMITMFTNLLRNVDVYVCRGNIEENDSQ